MVVLIAEVNVIAATGSPTRATGLDEGTDNPARAAGLRDVWKENATGKPTRAAGLEDATCMLRAVATDGATNTEGEEATVSDLTKIPVRPLPPHDCVGLPEHEELQEVSSTAVRGVLNVLPHLQIAPSVSPKYL